MPIIPQPRTSHPRRTEAGGRTAFAVLPLFAFTALVLAACSSEAADQAGDAAAAAAEMAGDGATDADTLPYDTLRVTEYAGNPVAPGTEETSDGVDLPFADSVPHAALATITAEQMAAHVQVLASDSFGGRAPASPGEEMTVNYLVEQFRELGLEPGNGDSWVQEVGLVSIEADPSAHLWIAGGTAAAGEDGAQEGDSASEEADAAADSALALAYGDEFMAWTRRAVEEVALEESPLVFVGYGIVAPEYGWNDYDGLDVEGKTVVMLVNDPGYATRDSALFNGRSMTYYGRWTYKFDEAARQGAAGALIVHETGAAGYPWEVVRNSWSGPQFGLTSDLVPEGSGDETAPLSDVEGWLPREVAQVVFERAGLPLDSLEEAAASREFVPVALQGLTVSVELQNTVDTSSSRNVVARLPGAERPEEHVIYMAHHDHFGTDPSLEGDSIYNGAKDNATGVAGLLEMAQAFTEAPRPARSLLFLAVAAEEYGLLGSAHYAAHPVVPPAHTVAAINMDGMNTYGPMGDVTVIGEGMSELDDYTRAAAAVQGRVVRPDPEPEKGYYYRSDHFELAKRGVPSLYTDEGVLAPDKGSAWARAERDAYVAERYHKPQDEYDEETWDLRGAVDDLQLLFRVGWHLADTEAWPNWREGVEFRAVRDSVRGTVTGGAGR